MMVQWGQLDGIQFQLMRSVFLHRQFSENNSSPKTFLILCANKVPPDSGTSNMGHPIHDQDEVHPATQLAAVGAGGDLDAGVRRARLGVRMLTSGGLVIVGRHTLKTWSSTESVVPRSSAETEPQAMTWGST